MALEAIVFSSQQDSLLSYCCKDLYSSLGAAGSSWNYDFMSNSSSQFSASLEEKPYVITNNHLGLFPDSNQSPPSTPPISVNHPNLITANSTEWDRPDHQYYPNNSEWDRPHHQYYPNNSSSPDEANNCTDNFQYQLFGSAVAGHDQVSTPANVDASPSASRAAADASGRGGAAGRRKRRRKSMKNNEELESQRMTHIAVERNRRKQMNEYLAAIRSLMPASYVQRGDQASIIGGAINYVKELEQLLHSLETQRKGNKFKMHEHDEEEEQHRDHEQKDDQQHHQSDNDLTSSGPPTPPSPPIFADFFTFPQFSARPNFNQPKSSNSSSSHINSSSSADHDVNDDGYDHDDDNKNGIEDAAAAKYGSINTVISSNKINSCQSTGAEIEVAMADSHANVKILVKRQPKQLLKLVASFQSLRFSVLHLNVTTTVDNLVLYSFSLKVDEGSQFNSVEEIAAATNQIIAKIQEDSCCCSSL